ncbi:MAG: ABC transporter permease [Dehalococcoidales bacterium]
MGRYLLRRLIALVPTLFLITLIIFLLVRFIPGNVVDLMAADMSSMSSASNHAVTAASLRHMLGLDVPVQIQYLHWINNIFHGNFGKSLWSGQNIGPAIMSQLPVSVELGAMALILAVFFALPVGIYSAAHQETWGDYSGRTIAILAISVPAFWLGAMVIVYPSIWWNWTHPLQYIPLGQNIGGNLLQFIIPATILGMGLAGSTMRLTRTMMLETLRQDYIRTAWSKGLTANRIVWRHALHNALMPIVTNIGNQLPILVGGSVVLEQIFDLPGIGRYLLTALNQRDYPIISAVTLIMAAFILIMNIFVDILYGYLDPRIKYD